MLQEIIDHYHKVNPSVADIIRKMAKCLESENIDELKRLNGVLNADHRLTLGVQSGANWADARFMVAPVSEARIPGPDDFAQVADDFASPVKTDLTVAILNEGRYTTVPVPNVFANDGHGIYAPDGELIGIMKGIDRAELYIGMAEQIRGNSALAEWSAYFHDRLRHHEDRDRAIREADSYFATRQSGGDTPVRPA